MLHLLLYLSHTAIDTRVAHGATEPPMPPRPTITPTPALRYWQSRRALLQRELAERAGVDCGTVLRLERGLPAELDTVRRLAEALDVTPRALIRPPLGCDASIVSPPAS